MAPPIGPLALGIIFASGLLAVPPVAAPETGEVESESSEPSSSRSYPLLTLSFAFSSATLLSWVPR